MSAKGNTRGKVKDKATEPRSVDPDLWHALLANHFDTARGPGWLLVHGDCLQVLAAMPSRSCAVVMTDPPYEAEAHTDQRRQRGAKITPGGEDEYREVNDAPLAFAAITAEQRTKVAALIAKVAAHRALAFCQAEAVDAWKHALNAGGMPYRRALPWTKPDAMPSLHGRWPGQSYESIVLAQHRTAPACPIGGKARVYTCTRDAALYSRGGASAKAPHPTTKPQSLMRALVDDFTEAGDLVVDPFCGSASTGLACIALGRMFVGVERDADFFEVSCRRMRGEIPRPLEGQAGLFDQRSA